MAAPTFLQAWRDPCGGSNTGKYSFLPIRPWTGGRYCGIALRELAGGAAMQPITIDVLAVRQEMLDLLRQQMAVLDSPAGLTDAQLRECYVRQIRVQELRERLQAAFDPEPATATEASPAPPIIIPHATVTESEQCFS